MASDMLWWSCEIFSFPALISIIIAAISVAYAALRLRITDVENLVVFTDPNTKKTFTGKLDAADFENGTHDDFYTFGMALLCNAVVIESATPLESSDLRKALVMLLKRYPMLRMKFKWTVPDGRCHRYLVEMADPENVCLLDEASSQWQERLETELVTPFESDAGLLWRVVRMQEEYNDSTKKYKNTVLFTFHHSICDGISMMTLLEQFWAYLEQCLEKSDEVEKVQSMCLLPPLQELVKHKVEMTWWKALLFVFKLKIGQLSKSVRRPKHLFFQRFPPVIMTDPSITRKTCFIPMVLSERETTQLITQCKMNHCTVTGALTASSALAIRNVIHGTVGSDRPMQVGVGLPVSIRKDCQVSKEHCGVFLSPLPFTITLPHNASHAFWDLSRDISEDIYNRLGKKEQYNYLRMVKYAGMRPAEEFVKLSQDHRNAGRWDGLLEISNCGKFQLGMSPAGKLEFVSTHYVVAQHSCGSLLTNNIVTVNGRLFWTVVFSRHVMTREQAQEYCDLACGTLKQNIGM